MLKTDPQAVGGEGRRNPLSRLAGVGRSRRRTVRQAPWVLVLPALTAVVCIRVLPTLFGGVYAFTSWNGLGLTAKWVGLKNLSTALSDPATRGALWHTLELASAFVVLVNVCGLALALGLRRALKTRKLLRAVFFLPVVLGELAVAYIWSYIFSYTGPVNSVLRFVGLASWQKVWLADPTWSLWVILVVLVWQFTGLAMVLYLAGLEGIPDELDDAASVDGASNWTKFRRVTFPLLAPALTVSTTLTWIFGLRIFDQVIALTGGGPVNATQTLSTEVWQNTFVYGHYGYGASLALIMTAVIAAVALSQAALMRRREARL